MSIELIYINTNNLSLRQRLKGKNQNTDSNDFVDAINVQDLIKKLKLGQVGTIKDWDQSQIDGKVMSKIMQLQKQQKAKKQKNNHVPQNQFIPVNIAASKNRELQNSQKQLKELSIKKAEEEMNGKLAKKSGKQFKEAISIPYTVNLGSLSFQDIGKQCHRKGILSDQMYKQFARSNSNEQVKEFVKMFDSGKIQNNDFTSKRVTIMDHRRMCEYLIKFYPEQYCITEIRYDDPLVRNFLYNLYQLASKEYKLLINSLDNSSRVTWWNKIEQNCQKKLIQNKNSVQPSSNQKGWSEVKREKKFIKKQINLVQIDPAIPEQGRKRVYNKQYELSSSSLSSEQAKNRMKAGISAPKKKIFK